VLNKGTCEKVSVTTNIADNCRTGIFIESTGRVIITGNHIFNTTNGFLNESNKFRQFLRG
jgi:parallel beta-helix repeat protein